MTRSKHWLSLPVFLIFVLIWLDIGSCILYAGNDTSRTIAGRIVDAETGAPLMGANVRLSGTLFGTATNADGKFQLKNLQTAICELEISFVGYGRITLEQESWQEGRSDQQIVIQLQPKPIKLSEIVVGPGAFSLSKSLTTEFQFTKAELRVTSMGIDDPLRVLQLLPGTNTDFMNAKIGIRGSRPDQMLYVIDGMEIYGSIFHMDRLQGSRTTELNGLISSLNTEIIDDLTISLGGFPSKYGNKSGGLLAIKTLAPDVEGVDGNVSLNIAKVGGLLKGKFGNNRFVLSAQRGYFDLVFALFGQNTNFWPYYYDVFGKYEHTFSSGRLFVQAFRAWDQVEFSEKPSSKDIISSTNYSLNHVWGGVDLILSPSLLGTTIAYVSVLPEKTWYDAPSLVERNFSHYEKNAWLSGLKQTMLYEISNTQTLESGLNIKYTRSRYRFFQTYQETIADSIRIVTSDQVPHGYDFGSYVSYKRKAFDGILLLEAGARIDYQTYIPNNHWQFSPRIALAVHLPYETVLRGATGTYYEPTDIANIYNYTPGAHKVTRNIHYILGVENRFISRSQARFEAYYKRIAPERRAIMKESKILPLSHGFAYGLDLFLKKQYDYWLVWLGYSYGMAQDVAGNVKVFRLSDRRHSFSANVNLAVGYGWNFNMTFRYATPRPYTKRYFEQVKNDTGTYWKSWYGFPNEARGTPYSQLNIAISKATMIAWGKLSWQIQILNVLNSQGVWSYRTYLEKDQRGELRPVEANSVDMPRLITFGILWEF